MFITKSRFVVFLCVCVIAGSTVSNGQSDTRQPQNTPPWHPQVTPEQVAAYQKAQEEQLHSDWANLGKYRAEDGVLAPARKAQVVFMGDSITEQWGQKNNPLFSDLGEFFPGQPYINRGISGQTSPQMLVRFRQDVVELKPKVVVILTGTNDIAGNTGPMELTDTEKNIESMTEMARVHGIKVVLCAVPPAREFWWKPGFDPSPKIKELNHWIRQYADSMSIPYVDYYSALNDGKDGLRGDLSSDGVHPNAKGYAVMAPLARQGITEALKSPAVRSVASDH
jgi:lysophospholipase L1-like esterase